MKSLMLINKKIKLKKEGDVYETELYAKKYECHLGSS